MNAVLQLGDVCQEAAGRLRTATGPEVLSLLAEYQMLPLLIKEMVIDAAITPIQSTTAEETLACEQVAKQYKERQQEGMTPEQLNAIAIRQLKLEKFKEAAWGGDIDAYFFQRKPQLDRAIYSLISTNDIGIAQEIYFRIQEGEQSFGELAKEYAQGLRSSNQWFSGSVELQSIHPILAKILSVSQPQQLLPPTQIGEWIVIIRLEKLLPAQLDRPLRQRLINERFNNWLQTQMANQDWQINDNRSQK